MNNDFLPGLLQSNWQTKFKNAFFLISLLTILSFASANVQAINVLVVGNSSNGNLATEEIFTNGDLTGSVNRLSWLDYRELTTEQIIANYDVMVIPYNTADWQYDINWTARLLPFMASGGGIVWEGYITTGTGGNPLITQQLGPRYVCTDGTICYIPNSSTNPFSPLDVVTAPGLSDGLTGDFTSTLGYFNTFDSRLSPLVQVNATGLGTITYALYGDINAGRIMMTQMVPDNDGLSTGSAKEVNSYNFLKNAIEWVSSSTALPDPDLRIIPNLSGLNEADAIAAVSSAGLTVGNLYYTTTNLDISGNVVSQTPQAGSGGFAGDALTLFVVAPATGAEVTVPDIKGMLTADAVLTLESTGLVRGSLVWSSHPTVPAGAIISQNRAAGQTSTEGWIVDVAESTGPNSGTVPFVEWLPQTDAETALAAAGYVTGNVAVQSHNVIPAGNVIDQVPGDDFGLALGSPVDLVISSGPVGSAPVITPGVIALLQADAESAITSAGLNVSVTTQISDTVTAGVVISQTPLAGVETAAGTVVTLVVSAGPAPVIVSVPDVNNASQTIAESTIISAGLLVGNVTATYSDTVIAGNVISQNPLGGTNIVEGSTIDLVISSGPAPVVIIVPNVVGLSQITAESTITTAGLSVGTVTTANSSTVATGDVISQTPTADSSVSQGTAIDLVVSTGPALVTVPSVVVTSQAAAESAITSAGLTVGNVTATSSDTVAAGDVISQTPASGTEVVLGISVDLLVSTGSALVTVPSVVGSSYSAAITAIENAGLVVGNVSTVTTRSSCGSVRSQTPAGNTNVASGTAVDLVVTRTRRCNPL